MLNKLLVYFTWDLTILTACHVHLVLKYQSGSPYVHLYIHTLWFESEDINLREQSHSSAPHLSFATVLASVDLQVRAGFISPMFGEAEEARWYAVNLSYAAVLSAIMLLFLAFTGYSELSDEKLMSVVVFIVIAFVEMIGSVFVVMVWQPQKVYT